MRLIFIILINLFFISSSFSTGQSSDILYLKGDTFSIFNNPLEQYFNKVGNRDIVGLVDSCWSTSCRRGYIATWKISNDSLELVKISNCHKNCNGATDANMFEMFGELKVFAGWYSGILTIPTGRLFSGSDMGYSAIYEAELKIEVNSGRVKSIVEISNKELIESIKLNNVLNNNVLSLKDTIYKSLITSLKWSKLDNDYIDCLENYVLFFNKYGKLEEVKTSHLKQDSSSFNDKIYDLRIDKKCLPKIKRALKNLNLSYIKPHRNFVIEINLFYSDSLEIRECREFYPDVLDEHIYKKIKSSFEK